MMTKKTVALVDWNWMGHHPTYYHKFLEAFCRLDCDVLPVCSNEALDEVHSWSSTSGQAARIHAPIRARRPRRRQSILPEALRGPEQAITGFGRLERQLRSWERESGKRIDLVFFSTIYDSDFSHFNAATPFFTHPWSGIYLHARAFRLPGTPLPYSDQVPRPKQIFTSRHMSSVCLLDEGCTVAMKDLAGDKPVIEFPDITNTSIVNAENSLAKKIRSIVGSKKLVVCLGALQKTKGLRQLCEAAIDPCLQDVFFFFGGSVHWGGTSPDEQSFICSVWETAPNVLTHLQRFDDSVMNELIQESDLVFAAYTNFPNSSNVMTKAAFFGKPLVVSDGFLMAERVRRHRLGRIVPEGSVPDITREIRDLCDHGGDPEADYSGYYARHSDEALNNALTRVIEAAS